MLIFIELLIQISGRLENVFRKESKNNFQLRKINYSIWVKL